VNRRTFLSTVTAGLLAAPLAAEAQPAGKVPQVGILSAGPLAPRMYRWEAFRQRLRELRYTEGQNIALVFRAPEREGLPLDELAAELVQVKVDIIIVQSVLAAQAAKRASGSIPIVMAGVSDPLRAGLIGSLARPGGNVTGVSMMSTELSGKRLELLREIAPAVSRVGSLWNPTNPVSVVAFRDSEVRRRR
jgi:putative ABC transport system substrate-binding protein